MIAKLKALWPGLVGAGLSAGVGWLVVSTTFGLGLVYLSYELPFPQRNKLSPPEVAPEVALIYLDDESAEKLGQPPGRPWDRRIFAKLLDRLTADGAKSVTFDIVFLGPSPTGKEEDDQLLAAAIKRNGKVVLGANPIHMGYEEGALTKGFAIVPPFDPLAEAAANLGTVVQYPERDLMIRRHVPFLKNDLVPPLAWAAAQTADAPVTKEENSGAQERWINYYGPPKSLPYYSIWRIVSDDAAPPPAGEFRNKHIFVGANFITRLATDRKDEYPSPFRNLYQGEGAQKFISGVEVNATVFLNLLRGDWLIRTEARTETWGIVLIGAFCGFVFTGLRPAAASAGAISLATFSAVAGYLAFTRSLLWFPWAILTFAVVPVAWGWAVLYNAYVYLFQTRRYEQSLSFYLSPKLVKKFAKDENFLKTGAEKQELSILFSDIANFTSLSEGMDGDQLAKLMNGYFDRAIPNCIFKTDGTVMKYIGDAIFAVWNAPDPQPDHAVRACRAALLLRDGLAGMTLGESGPPLRTRIGLHTGVASIGNFGSKERFGYDAVGENINLASRMEGLNKYLGTGVLITGDTHQQTNGQFITRRLGLFRLKGFEKAVDVYELVSELDTAGESQTWREAFAKGVECWERQSLDQAETAFRRTLEIKLDDGPSKFFLDRLADLKMHPPDGEWDGVVELKEK